ncbi:MAG: LOG family protein [Deltaproteobacteria bacterium]|nr:LOG family protein [Deltaproteobacteria bacterium]
MDEHYRVAIFGSARLKEGDKIYQDVFAISKGLAEHGFDIVTGGGPGLMLAANSGHKSANSGTHSLGLNIRLPFEQIANPYLDIKEEFDRFSDRLDSFVSLSDVVVVCPGGIGTLLELFYAWQLVQVEHLCETPIILFGEMWSGLLDWLQNEVLFRELFSHEDMNHIFHLNSPADVVSLVSKIHDDRSKVEHVCHNFKKYRVEFTPSETDLFPSEK